jgi:hypothetical protein
MMIISANPNPRYCLQSTETMTNFNMYSVNVAHSNRAADERTDYDTVELRIYTAIIQGDISNSIDSA